MNIENKAQRELKAVLKLARKRGCTEDGIFVMNELKMRGWEFRSYIGCLDSVSKTSHYCGYHGCYGTGVMHKMH